MAVEDKLDYEVIRTRIHEMLKRKDWSEYVLAGESGVPYPTIWRFLNRRHKTMDAETIMRIACAFGKVTSQLTGEMPLDRSEAEEAVTKDPNIATAAITMTHMSQETRAQYVKIGNSLADSANPPRGN